MSDIYCKDRPITFSLSEWRYLGSDGLCSRDVEIYVDDKVIVSTKTLQEAIEQFDRWIEKEGQHE